MMSRAALVAMLNSTVVFFSGETTTVHLFQNDLTLTPDVVVGDFVEADFDGYSADTTIFTGAAWDDENQNAVLSFDGTHFQPSGGGTPNTIYGWWLSTTAAELPGILIAQRFPTPIAMNSALDAIDIIPLLKIGLPVE